MLILQKFSRMKVVTLTFSNEKTWRLLVAWKHISYRKIASLIYCNLNQECFILAFISYSEFGIGLNLRILVNLQPVYVWWYVESWCRVIHKKSTLIYWAANNGAWHPRMDFAAMFLFVLFLNNYSFAWII